MTINEEIELLKKQVFTLQTKLADLSLNLEEKAPVPYTKTGTGRDNSQNRPVEPRTGLGGTQGGNLGWNDSELKIPNYGVQPPEPTKGYNKHGHSRYSGGAFDIGTIEFVEYETNESGNIIDSNGDILNKHCQQYWSVLPDIVKVEKNLAEGGSEFLEKIGGIRDSMVFDTSDGQWKFFAVYAEEDEE